MIPRGTQHLSRPLATWEKKAPDQHVLDLINRSGTDIFSDKTGMKKVAGTFSLSPNKTVKPENYAKENISSARFSLKSP